MIGAEVDPLLAVRATGGQFAADREPPTPRPTGTDHGDLGLLDVGQCEELVRGTFEFGLQRRVDAVTDDAEESDLSARLIDLAGHLGDVGGARCRIEERPDVDDRQVGCGAHNW